MIVVDIQDTIVGRAATKIAKMAISGEEVRVINCDQAVFSGSEENVLAKFKQARERTVPLQGPYIHRNSDAIVKRSIRGMIPHKTPKGRAAFERVKTYTGVPEAFKSVEAVKFDNASLEKLPGVKYVTVKRISEFLGGKK